MDRSTGCRIPSSEHHSADFHSSDSMFAIQSHNQRLGRKLCLLNMWEKLFGVEIHGVPANRLENGHACLIQQLSEIPYLSNPEVEVVLVQDFTKSSGHCFQITPRQPSVRGKAFHQDKHIGNSL